MRSQLTNTDGKDYLEYVVSSPHGRTIVASEAAEDVTANRSKYVDSQPNLSAPLIGPLPRSTTVDESLVVMLTDMLGVDRDKVHAIYHHIVLFLTVLRLMLR